ncbi:putative membrane protein [Actinocorallia herbida]|uniref:Putative membrane protein n=1 Tax=Actinocorallia herbida TaxID=58109 RepID=A0A3N1DAR3_9ACTN|nr:phage holin family protein [Actinocorallia herbida]ROO90604.1 putative membrane protein [Actinocorallia herbida]
MKILINVVITALALAAATWFLDGIEVTGAGDQEKALTLVLVALIFGLVNAVLKPIIKTVGCAFYVLTLGLFGLVVNALLLLLTSWIAGEFDLAFHVDDFLTALFGGVIVAVVSWVLSLVLDND